MCPHIDGDVRPCSHEGGQSDGRDGQVESVVGELTVPVAARLRRPSWRDPRLAVGLVLVAGSVALGSWAVTSAQATHGVYVARSTLTPGEEVDVDQLAVVQVRLQDADASHYFSPESPPPAGAVVLRQVAKGELVPALALGSPTDLDLRAVPVSLGTEPASDVVTGSLVDLWTVPPVATGTSSTAGAASREPVLLAAGLTVAEVVRPSGAFAVGGRTVVHVLVPSESLPKVLAAVSGDGTMQVMHVPGTRG